VYKQCVIIRVFCSRVKLLVKNYIMPYTSLAFSHLRGNDIIASHESFISFDIEKYKMRGDVRINVILRHYLADIVTVEKP